LQQIVYSRHLVAQGPAYLGGQAEAHHVHAGREAGFDARVVVLDQ
jgi:hypothetical protein